MQVLTGNNTYYGQTDRRRRHAGRERLAELATATST